MKNLFAISISLVLFFASSCKKKDSDELDTMAPIFTLKGKKADTVALNSTTYADSGAVAIDDFDGDISKRVVVTGTLNLNLTGIYMKFYDVADLTGNKAKQLTRSILVKNDASFLDGVYIATANCGATNTSSFVSTVEASSTVNNQIKINGIGLLDTGIVAVGKLNGLNMAITPGIHFGTSYSGSAIVNSNKKEFTLSYAISKAPSVSYACTTIYKKQ
jgi:Domain of unknown function (DUF5011)